MGKQARPAIAKLIECSADSKVEVRANAVRSLGKIGTKQDSSIINSLSKALDDYELLVKVYATKALLKFAPESTYPHTKVMLLTEVKQYSKITLALQALFEVGKQLEQGLHFCEFENIVALAKLELSLERIVAIAILFHKNQLLAAERILLKITNVGRFIGIFLHDAFLGLPEQNNFWFSIVSHGAN